MKSSNGDQEACQSTDVVSLEPGRRKWGWVANTGWLIGYVLCAVFRPISPRTHRMRIRESLRFLVEINGICCAKLHREKAWVQIRDMEYRVLKVCQAARPLEIPQGTAKMTHPSVRVPRSLAPNGWLIVAEKFLLVNRYLQNTVKGAASHGRDITSVSRWCETWHWVLLCDYW